MDGQPAPHACTRGTRTRTDVSGRIRMVDLTHFTESVTVRVSPVAERGYAGSMIGLEVVGVRMEMPSNTPIVLLRETDGERYLPIWVGAVEATAIAYAQQGVVPPRPLTHDLMLDLLEAVDAPLQEVRITDLSDGVFYSIIVFTSGLEVSARPSDAIALALRADVPIVGAEEVVQEAGIEIPDEEEPVEEDQVEQFRAFLDEVSPEDFGAPGPS